MSIAVQCSTGAKGVPSTKTSEAAPLFGRKKKQRFIFAQKPHTVNYEGAIFFKFFTYRVRVAKSCVIGARNNTQKRNLT